MGKIPKSVRLKWPVGPHYLRWVDGRGAHAWARYKVKSADWYLGALQITARAAGDLDRYVGIELALDGVLTAMCAAVDAAGCALLDAVVRAAGRPESDASYLDVGEWDGALEIARGAGISLASEHAILDALEGSGSRSPQGWLAQVRLLRDRAVRHNVLVRRFSVSGEPPGRFVDVPGLGPRRPIDHLKSTRRKVHELVELLLRDVDTLAGAVPPDSDEGGPRRIGPRPLPDLSARARVLRTF
ncbi:MAG: hypothetical protein M0Z33_02880 [Actinomycetota bacterium]|nr:hypothetical protein [Actinomycetota bacterium]